MDDEGVPASVSFLTARSSFGQEVASTHRSDADGRYEALLFPGQVTPMAMVSVRGSEPLPRPLERIPQDGDILDFDLSGDGIQVSVVDAVTEEPVAGATVLYAYGAGTAEAAGRGAQTDDRGRVSVPPVPGDPLVLGASKPGYRPSGRIDVDLTAPHSDPITIRLEPEEAAGSLLVRLATGEPAADAEVWLLTTLDGWPHWTGRADASGRVQIADPRPGDWLAARHPQAGLRLVPWDALTADSAPVVVLAPPGGALHLRLVDGAGAPVPFAPVVAWLDGRGVSDQALAWLTGSPSMTLRDGTWTATGLAAAPIEVLAWRRTGDPDTYARMTSGEMDYRRQPVAWPWPPAVELEAVLP